jgi:(p)ppGpp synthase/HD superfamily hydrolase
MINIAKEYATKAHQNTNHLYDGLPYTTHLEMVVKEANIFKHLIPTEDRENVLAACWLHDVIEDCRETYNDVRNVTNTTVADLVYALTNEKGKTRKERANSKYYKGIKETKYATFIKLCDRIANYKYSLKTGSSMANVYSKELPFFINILWCSEYEEMFIYLKALNDVQIHTS